MAVKAKGLLWKPRELGCERASWWKLQRPDTESDFVLAESNRNEKRTTRYARIQAR